MENLPFLFGMTLQAWVLLLTMLSMSGTAILIFLWGKKTGQFRKVEEITERMLEEDDEEVIKKYK